MSHPEFVDNLDGNTLERALRERLEHLLGTLREPPCCVHRHRILQSGGLRSAGRRAPPRY